MADTTDILGLPFPDLDGGDTADVPRDIHALAVAIEQQLLNGAGHHPGDIKHSARSADHGRWLLLDGRELTAAEICTALSLPSGSADALVAVLGVGTSSLYGDASSGKVKLPDMRDKFAMTRGSSHPAKGAGSSGGVETVTLTANQSGVKSHTHGISDPGHTHSASTASAQPAVTITDPGHAHGVSGNHPTHKHLNQIGYSGESGDFATPGSYFPVLVQKVNAGASAAVAAQGVASGEWSPSRAYTDSLTISAGSTGITAGQSAHTHSVTVTSASTGVSVQSHAGSPAADSHDNMPPYRTIGSAFIRV